MKFKITNYTDLKAVAILKKIKIDSELPLLLGYKSRWGLKKALENPNKKNNILKKANEIFFS